MADARLDLRPVLTRRLEQLRRGQRAQRNRWGNSPSRPPGQWMSCRQPSASFGGTTPTSARIPSAQAPGEVGQLQIAADHRPLQTESQDDVGGIGHLVGVDADQAALHPGVEAVEIVGRPGRPVAAEGIAHQWREVLQERSRARAVCISTSRLWLSCAAMPRAWPTGWASQPAGRPCSYEGVAGLVHSLPISERVKSPSS